MFFMDLKPDEVVGIIKEEIKNYGEKHNIELNKTGSVIELHDGIAHIFGLFDAMIGELVEFDGNVFGMIMNLETNSVGAIIFGDSENVHAGSKVKLTGRVVEVPVGYGLLGRVVNALGEPIDHKGKINFEKKSPIEKIAPGVIKRKEVNVPLETGIKAIDAMVPIGRGQRELIIGDRQTGKTAICIDTILNQKGKDVYCVYVAIGQKKSTVSRMVKIFEDHGALDYTIIVCASASDGAPMQYIAPYAGCAIAEEFMAQGKDALIIYDDLSKHAVAYRTMSLLLRRPPGREAYPGDVFYLHSRLLERAARLDEKYGGGSLTALPIIETQAGDVSAYIPTNVISITDGQIYLETELFNSGVRPAINPGLSVSRVGGSAQTKAMKKIAGPIRIELAQYRELEAFSQFGSELDANTLKRLEKGKRLLEVLKQKQYDTMALEEEIIILYAVTKDYLQDIPVEKILAFEKEFLSYIKKFYVDVIDIIKNKKDIDKNLEARIKEAIDKFKEDYLKDSQE